MNHLQSWYYIWDCRRLFFMSASIKSSNNTLHVLCSIESHAKSFPHSLALDLTGNIQLLHNFSPSVFHILHDDSNNNIISYIYKYTYCYHYHICIVYLKYNVYIYISYTARYNLVHDPSLAILSPKSTTPKALCVKHPQHLCPLSPGWTEKHWKGAAVEETWCLVPSILKGQTQVGEVFQFTAICIHSKSSPKWLGLVAENGVWGHGHGWHGLVSLTKKCHSRHGIFVDLFHRALEETKKLWPIIQGANTGGGYASPTSCAGR